MATVSNLNATLLQKVRREEGGRKEKRGAQWKLSVTLRPQACRESSLVPRATLHFSEGGRRLPGASNLWESKSGPRVPSVPPLSSLALAALQQHLRGSHVSGEGPEPHRHADTPVGFLHHLACGSSFSQSTGTPVIVNPCTFLFTVSLFSLYFESLCYMHTY